MPRLADIQDRFSALVTEDNVTADAASEVMFGHDGAPVSKADRMSVYRNNYISHMTQSLMKTYELITALTGDHFALMMAQDYARAHVPDKGNMHDYGAEYADFIADFELARAVPYLPDMARLEWALHAAYHAADDTPLSIAALQAVDDGDLDRVRLRFRAAVRLISSDYPVFDIRNMCLRDGEQGDDAQGDDAQGDGGQDDAGHIDLAARGGQNCLIYRTDGPDMTVKIHKLEDDDYAAISAVRDGASLAEMAAMLKEDDAAEPDSQRLGTLLEFLFANGLIRDMITA